MAYDYFYSLHRYNTDHGEKLCGSTFFFSFTPAHFPDETTIPTQTFTPLSQLQLLQKVFLALCTYSAPLLWATSRAAQPACPLSVGLLPHGGQPVFVPLFVHSFLHLFIHSRNNDWVPMMGKVPYQPGLVTAANKTHGPCLHGAPVWLAWSAQEQGVRWEKRVPGTRWGRTCINPLEVSSWVPAIHKTPSEAH